MTGAGEGIDRVPCGFLATTAAGTILDANAALLALTGHRREDLVGRRRFTVLLTGGGRIYHETHYAPLLHTVGHVREVAFDLVSATGERLPVLVNAVLVPGSDNRPPEVRIALFAVAERRDYERELLHAKAVAEASEARARLMVRTLQGTLIPPAVPSIDGLDIAAAYRPAGIGDEVGGDFYDVFEVADDDWLVAVGDVTGTGVDAAMITALARYTIRAAAVRGPDPRRIVATLNDVLRRDESNRFCTVVIVRLTRRDGAWQATTCRGGHPLTLLVRADGAVRELGEPGTLLGFHPNPTVRLVAVVLDPGDAIVLYTDGVTEGRRPGELFGEPRTHDSLRRHVGSANGLTYGLLDEVVQFQGGATSDDIVIVAVQGPGSVAGRA